MPRLWCSSVTKDGFNFHIAFDFDSNGIFGTVDAAFPPNEYVSFGGLGFEHDFGASGIESVDGIKVDFAGSLLGDVNQGHSAQLGSEQVINKELGGDFTEGKVKAGNNVRRKAMAGAVDGKPAVADAAVLEFRDAGIRIFEVKIFPPAEIEDGRVIRVAVLGIEDAAGGGNGGGDTRLFGEMGGGGQRDGMAAAVGGAECGNTIEGEAESAGVDPGGGGPMRTGWPRYVTSRRPKSGLRIVPGRA